MEGPGPAGQGERRRGGGCSAQHLPRRVCRDPPCATRPTHAGLASHARGDCTWGLGRRPDIVPGITASWRDTVKLNGARKAREMFSERGTAGWGGGTTLPAGGGPAPASYCSLGGQRVVVTFTALALAAKHKRSGQEQERGGHQEQEPEASEDAHDLQGGDRAEGEGAGPQAAQA